MKKIPTIYLRDYDGPEHARRYVTREPNPLCTWVFKGYGVPHRKWNGACVMLDERGDWWARREVRQGKPTPDGYIPLGFDQVTRKFTGWQAISQSPFRDAFAEALGTSEERNEDLAPGTYELIGPKINGNPHDWIGHGLVPHTDTALDIEVPTDFDALATWLHGDHDGLYIEGIVWHHPDGRMGKIKARDFPTPEHP